MRMYVPCVPFCWGSAPATRTELQHPGVGGGAREGGEGEGGGGNAHRGPQSLQSVPIEHQLASDPGPPSSQLPLDA